MVFATHADTTLAMLGEGAEADERAALSAVPYNANDVYLHTGASALVDAGTCTYAV